MAKCGSMPTPISPGSLYLIEFRPVTRSLSSVVHCCPVFLTYCRSSRQIVQALGGWSPSAYCVPQVVQMKFGMVTLPRPITGNERRLLHFDPRLASLCLRPEPWQKPPDPLA